MIMRMMAGWVARALAAQMSAAAQESPLATVLLRAAESVADFHRQLSGVVAEERYLQEVKAFARYAGRLVSPLHTSYASIGGSGSFKSTWTINFC